jgi:hypothetical protein
LAKHAAISKATAFTLERRFPGLPGRLMLTFDVLGRRQLSAEHDGAAFLAFGRSPGYGKLLRERRSIISSRRANSHKMKKNVRRANVSKIC